MDGASPNCLGSGRHGVRSELPTPTRRCGRVSVVALPFHEADEEDEWTHIPAIGQVPILGQDPPFSVPPTVPASSDATVGGCPRQFERSRDASIVAGQANNDNDADDERHHLFLRTWSMFWS